MTELLEQAIAQVRTMPEATQDSMALLILAFADRAEGEFALTDEEMASFERSLAQADRGEFVSEEEMKALRAEFAE